MKKLLIGAGVAVVALVGLGFANALGEKRDKQRQSAFSTRW